MQTRNLVYLELIRLVHPDAGTRYSSHERAVMVNLHRDNPEKLKKMAVAWGVFRVQGSENAHWRWFEIIGLRANTFYAANDQWIIFRNKRCKVYKTTQERVYLSNRYGVFSIHPKAGRPCQ